MEIWVNGVASCLAHHGQSSCVCWIFNHSRRFWKMAFFGYHIWSGIGDDQRWFCFIILSLVAKESFQKTSVRLMRRRINDTGFALLFLKNSRALIFRAKRLTSYEVTAPMHAIASLYRLSIAYLPSPSVRTYMKASVLRRLADHVSKRKVHRKYPTFQQ